MHHLLRLIVLLHLAGILPKHNQAMPQGPQGPKQTPQAQGGHGMAQGFQGEMAPLTGGLGSAKNKAGLYPHQQNPFLMMSGQQRPKL